MERCGEPLGDDRHGQRLAFEPQRLGVLDGHKDRGRPEVPRDPVGQADHLQLQAAQLHPVAQTQPQRGIGHHLARPPDGAALGQPRRSKPARTRADHVHVADRRPAQRGVQDHQRVSPDDARGGRDSLDLGGRDRGRGGKGAGRAAGDQPGIGAERSHDPPPLVVEARVGAGHQQRHPNTSEVASTAMTKRRRRHWRSRSATCHIHPPPLRHANACWHLATSCDQKQEDAPAITCAAPVRRAEAEHPASSMLRLTQQEHLSMPVEESRTCDP
jgi:hypothetical protein